MKWSCVVLAALLIWIAVDPTCTADAADGKLTGRSADQRAKRVEQEGGDASTEAAVENGFRWLVEHQMPDGGWHFDHGKSPRHIGPKNNPGNMRSRTGATGLAVLAFLGAGRTHTQGEYKEPLRRGLYFLGKQIKLGPDGGDLRGSEWIPEKPATDQAGDMYCHALGTAAVCEAYAMTGDKALRVLAEQATRFIVAAQERSQGGWGAAPQTPGETTQLGWQMMALNSAQIASFKVPRSTIAGAENFLNLMQQDGGAYYGSNSPGKLPTPTAIGLLVRMQTGWQREQPALERGIAYLSEVGPSSQDMVFNFYATQVMFHYGGEPWQEWNRQMKRQLIDRQLTRGEFRTDQGSWTPGEKSSNQAGGRLAETALAIMTLETYYRYAPLYRE